MSSGKVPHNLALISAFNLVHVNLCEVFAAVFVYQGAFLYQSTYSWELLEINSKPLLIKVLR